MTRRSFISDMLKCGVATTFLPGAGRIWKPRYAPARFIHPRLVYPFWMETFHSERYVSKEYVEALRRIVAGEDKSIFGDPPDMKAFSIQV